MPIQHYCLLLENGGYLLLESGGRIIIATLTVEADEGQLYEVAAETRQYARPAEDRVHGVIAQSRQHSVSPATGARLYEVPEETRVIDG